MTSASDPPSVRANLLHDHEEIDRSLEHLVEAFATGDRDVARDAFRALDGQLSAHLALEDEVLLPQLAEIYPLEAGQLVREHLAIRAMLDELGVGTDLHATRLPAIRKLAETLRAHAQREDALFYPWIDTQPRPRELARPSPPAPTTSASR
jgi:hypothetical protein